jgi:hypothetical protein
MAQQQVTGQVGQTGPVATGAPNTPIRQSNYGDVVMSELNGRYYEHCVRGNVFSVCNSAAQALSLTGTTTYTGLVLYNQPNSGKNLVILEAEFIPTTAETGVGAVILFDNPIAATVPSLTTTNVATGAIQNNLSGAVSSVAKPASACTLAANPVFLKPLFSMQFGTAVGLNMFAKKDEIAGSIIIPPGACIGIVAVTTAITGIGYLSWAELSSTVL